MSRFAVCLDNGNYQASLEKRKLYECVPDSTALKHNQIRIIDESGESYLFPMKMFLEIPLPEIIAQKIEQINQ